jgi:hypothetical protein
MKFRIVLLEDSLRHIVRRIPECKTAVGVPQEALCMIYDEQEIKEYYNKFMSLITGVPCAIEYHMDDMGFDSWINASPTAVVVPTNHDGTEISVPIARSNSRASMIGCVTGDCRFLKSYIFIPRRALEMELHESSFPLEGFVLFINRTDPLHLNYFLTGWRMF